MRVGIGYDVHKLVEGRKLILGGVDIRYHKGLLGHSDADVLVHAICDALLGACGQGDIGRHFPDNDPLYKDISSLIFLDKVNNLLTSKKLRIENIDSIIIAEEPKILPYVDAMKRNISKALNIEDSRINIKATTQEGLGAFGRKEGIAAQAIVLISIEK
ncbi:MAG: 2-C-methyl-D-erythritol 2,4-cyclodiphosphate synthase [Elusimicrobiota bacterium]